MFLSAKADAAVVNLTTDGEFQEYINKTGFKILNYNGIEDRVIFKYSPSKSVYGAADTKDMSVSVPQGILINVESEDELAWAVAHQLSYCLMAKENSFSKLTGKLSPKKYETLADKKAVDMLVKADYSPLAAIIMINKLYGEKKSSRHVKTSARLMDIYEYIYRKYPEKLENKHFSNNVYFQNFLLTSRKNREMLNEQLQQSSYETKRNEYR